MSTLKNAHVQNIYRPVSIVFAVLVVLFIVGVVYAGWSSSVITVTPKLNQVNASFPVTIGGETTDGSALAGTVTTEEKSATVTVTPTGTGAPVPAHASGQVTIKNTTAKEQPLAVGTRLQADSGVIVRTTQRVDVPANGDVEVTTIADPLGETGNLPPGKFVIVALWPGLQDKIYGQSTVTFSGGLAAGGTSLSLEELTTASDQAVAKISLEVGTSRPGFYISLEPTSVVSDPKPEVASASYAVTVTMRVTTVTYPTAELQQLITQELTKALALNQTLQEPEAPSFRIDDRPTTDRIVLHVDVASAAYASSTSPLLQRATFTGLTVEEITKKLADQSIIKSSQVKLSPWWRSTAPVQADRITLIILPAQS